MNFAEFELILGIGIDYRCKVEKPSNGLEGTIDSTSRLANSTFEMSVPISCFLVSPGDAGVRII